MRHESINLHISRYNEWYRPMVLKNRCYFLALRMDSHAQRGKDYGSMRDINPHRVREPDGN